MLRGINTHTHMMCGLQEVGPSGLAGLRGMTDLSGHGHSSVNQLGDVTAWHPACRVARRTVNSNGPRNAQPAFTEPSLGTSGSNGKNPPAVQETRVRSLGREAHLEEEMAAPFQYSHLEKSKDRGAWWAPAHRVTESQARLSNYTTHWTPQAL